MRLERTQLALGGAVAGAVSLEQRRGTVREVPMTASEHCFNTGTVTKQLLIDAVGYVTFRRGARPVPCVLLMTSFTLPSHSYPRSSGLPR